MIIVVAKNYQSYKGWLEDAVRYVGDIDLHKVDPATVSRVLFVGDNFRDHPVYFSDELLELQCQIAANKPKKPKFNKFWSRVLGV